MRQAALAFALRDELSNEWLRLPGGRLISAYDLHVFVTENPELAELAKRARAFPVIGGGGGAQGSGGGGGGAAAAADAAAIDPLNAAWYAAAAPAQRSAPLPPAAAAKLEWGLLAAGEAWGRRPARWLPLLGAAASRGTKDWAYAAYVHEGAAAAALGPRWAGRRPDHVLSDAAYRADVAALGPRMGATFVVTAMRQMELQKVRPLLACLLVAVSSGHAYVLVTDTTCFHLATMPCLILLQQPLLLLTISQLSDT